MKAGSLKVQSRSKGGKKGIRVKQLDKVALVFLEGRLVSNDGAPQLEDAFSSIMGRRCFKIVVDMEFVDYLSSRAMRALLETVKKCRRHRGDLLLCNLSAGIKEALDLCGITGVLKTYKSRQEAIDSFYPKKK